MDTPPVTVRLRSIVMDCPDPVALARFYAELLGGRIATETPAWCVVEIDDAPTLSFQRVEHYVAPEWPDGTPQQVHLDIGVSDLHAVSRRALALGARVVTGLVAEPGCVFMVHADPAGHPFCLCTRPPAP